MRYSEAALYNHFFRNGKLELCNNDCGTMIYTDVAINAVRNAAGPDADMLHKEVCDFLKKLRKGARSFNWYPNYTIDDILLSLFKRYDDIESRHIYDFDDLISLVGELKDAIHSQREKNKETKQKWDKEKADEAAAKKLSPEHKARMVDAQSQYNELLKDVEFRKRWQIDDISG
jgi:hypothetical protein